MLPLHSTQRSRRDPSEIPDVHPDDPLDSALQRMGEAGVDEIPVVSRAGGTPIGVLRAQDAFGAYKNLAGSKEQAKSCRGVRSELAAGRGGHHRGGGPHRVRACLLAALSPLRSRASKPTGRGETAGARAGGGSGLGISERPGARPAGCQSRGPRWASLSSSRVTSTTLHPICPRWLSVDPQNGPVWMGLGRDLARRGR